MVVKVMPSTDIRKKMREVLERVKSNDENIIITEHGKGVSVMISLDQYNYYNELIEDFVDLQAALDAKNEATVGLDDYLAKKK